MLTPVPVGAAAGCDLLTLLLKIKIKRSQPAAAPTEGIGVAPFAPSLSRNALNPLPCLP